MKFGRREDVTQRASTICAYACRLIRSSFIARMAAHVRPAEGAILKIRRRAGVPDVICIREGHVFALRRFLWAIPRNGASCAAFSHVGIFP